MGIVSEIMIIRSVTQTINLEFIYDLYQLGGLKI